MRRNPGCVSWLAYSLGLWAAAVLGEWLLDLPYSVSAEIPLWVSYFRPVMMLLIGALAGVVLSHLLAGFGGRSGLFAAGGWTAIALVVGVLLFIEDPPKGAFAWSLFLEFPIATALGACAGFLGSNLKRSHIPTTLVE